MVDGDAERRADGILAAIALADGVLLVVLTVEVELVHIHDLLGVLGQAVLLHERHYRGLDRGDRGGDGKDHAGLAVLELLLLVGVREDGQHHTVDADGGLDHVRSVAFAEFGVEILDLLSGEFLMVAEVEVGPGVDALKLLEAEGELALDIRGGVGVVRKLLMVVETVILRAHTEVHMPLHTGFLPLGEPVELGAGLDEELHLHLLELAHAEDELAGDDLVAESLADLGDTERYLHAAGLLDVQVVHKDALGGLGAQINGIGAFGGAAHRGAEHEVELTDVGPVAGAADGADDAAVDDDLAVLGQIVGVLGLDVAVVDLVVLGLLAQDVGVSGAELSLVETLAETLAALGDLLAYLFLDLAEIVLDEDIGAIALLGVLVIDERVVEGANVTGSLPDARMHKYAGIDAHYILVKARHGVPPILLDIVLEFGAHLSIIVHGGKSVIDLAGRENETILLAVCHQHLEKFVLCHNI